MKGWYGNGQKHSLASKGIRTKHITVGGERFDIEEEVYRTLSTIEYSDLLELLDSYTSDEEKIEWVVQWFAQGDYEYKLSDDRKKISVLNPYIEGSGFETRDVMEEWSRQTEMQDYDSLVDTLYNYMSEDERVDWIKNWHMED